MVTDVTPGLISDFVVGVFHHNAELRAVVVRFNNTDIVKMCSGLEPYVPKGNGDKCHTSYYIGASQRVVSFCSSSVITFMAWSVILRIMWTAATRMSLNFRSFTSTKSAR